MNQIKEESVPQLKTHTIIIPLGTIGNTEWWTEEDWIRHREYVERLKQTGEYLKPTEFEITIRDDPKWDTPSISNTSVKESYFFDIIDFSKIS
jgi:hypothetical protein